MPSPLELLSALTNPKEMPEQLDRAIVAQLLPDLAESKLPLDQIRFSTAIEILRTWRQGLTKSLGEGMNIMRKDVEKTREESQASRTKLVAAELRIQELQGELRAAKEGRGLYEDKNRTELERKLTAKERLLKQAADTEQTLNEIIQSLQAELRGRTAMVQRYEFDISQLTTASAAAAEQTRKDKSALDKLIAEARISLSNARNNIRDRWGTDLNPFMQAIHDDIVTALTKLPPPASP